MIYKITSIFITKMIKIKYDNNHTKAAKLKGNSMILSYINELTPIIEKDERKGK
jgi:hypothetical protein